MKLQVDRGNYQGLKVLICASLKGKTIELNVINLTGEFSLCHMVGGLSHFFLLVPLLSYYNSWMQLEKPRKAKKSLSKSDKN